MKKELTLLDGDKKQTEGLMTLKEVAAATGAAYRTVADYAQRAGWTKNGVETLLDEAQVTLIVEAMKRGANNQYDLASRSQGVETTKSRALRVAELYKQIEAELQAEIDELKPKAEFYDMAMASADCFTFDKAAHILKLPYGRNKLFARLRGEGVLKSNNVPYQEYIDSGYFVVDETPVKQGTSVKLYPTPKVTQKGITWLSKKYEQAGANRQTESLRFDSPKELAL